MSESSFNNKYQFYFFYLLNLKKLLVKAEIIKQLISVTESCFTINESTCIRSLYNCRISRIIHNFISFTKTSICQWQVFVIMQISRQTKICLKTKSMAWQIEYTIVISEQNMDESVNTREHVISSKAITLTTDGAIYHVLDGRLGFGNCNLISFFICCWLPLLPDYL